MNPSLVNWPAALASLEQRSGAVQISLRAEAAALAARFAADHGEGAARLAVAIHLQPLEPLHRVRLALHHLRFGTSVEALSVLERLPPSVRELPLPTYVKALAELRAGEAKRAANIAGALLTVDARHRLALFLEAEAQLLVAPKRLEKVLLKLPREALNAPLWADLLVKALVLRPGELDKSVIQQLDTRKVLEKGSPAERLVRRALAWSTATPDALEPMLEQLPSGSRAEQLALVLLDARALATDKGDARLQRLRRLHERAPERPAVRRLYASALTQRAVEEAAAERYPAALRVVEACLRLEPHETIHRQNRAALFTLMGEAEAYHEAWEDLERHHYRLALLGQTDRASARMMARPHRMFARQARLTPGDGGPDKARLQLGIFREADTPADGGERGLEVNQSRLDADPEQLRQWIHHRRAELVFSHLALGAEPERFLLNPLDPQRAQARADGLALCAESLAVLVSGEGRLLADRLSERWRALARSAWTRYARPEDDKEVQALRARHLETFADLALLCQRWEPDPARPELVEELLEFLRAVAPFFDEAAIAPVLADRESAPSWTVKWLSAYVRHTFEQTEGDLSLGEAQRRELASSVEGELLLNLAIRRFEAASSLEQLEHILELVDRARKANPRSPRVEFWAARIALRGDFLAEAKAALSRFHARVAGKETPYQAHVEELQRHLAERERAGTPGARRDAGAGASTALVSGDRIEQLEAEVEHLPTSASLYEELVHALAAAGRMDAALAWSERAIARCLSRDSQLRARALNLEVLGLRALAEVAPRAVSIYLAGSKSGALDALEAQAASATATYPLEYLRGQCLLAARRREEAQACLAGARARCERHLHLEVLRPLAESVEQALVDQLRRAVEAALRGGAPADALREVVATWPELKKPEVCVLEVARIQLAAVAASGDAPPLEALLSLAAKAPWAARLHAVVAVPAPLARARALAELAGALHEPAARELPPLLRKIELLERKEKSAAALAESSRLLRAGKLPEALAALPVPAEDDPAPPEPALLWQRALLSLRLERFGEADQAVATLEQGGDPGAREWLRRYPELHFRQRLTTINRHLRQGATAPAAELLSGTRASGQEQELELAYCRAFCLALQGYQHRREGALAQAVRALTEALDLLEPMLPVAQASGMARLPELRAKLDQDLADIQAEAR